MDREPHVTITLMELSRAWESLLDLGGISSELSYRIRRLIDRAHPLADKMFLKTIKGREMILQCWEETCAFRNQLESQDARLYEVLTDLEKSYEELIKRTYEFRVKAG